MKTCRCYALWAAIFAFIALIAAWTGNRIERDFGRIDVNTITFMTEEMQPMVAKLYRPKTATAAQPAPGLLALHGYQSDKEATNTFGALELARRGYVVLAIDQFGHGYSTQAPAANKNMSGANNGYQYLKTLPFVDKTRLGIFGHSTGALSAIDWFDQAMQHDSDLQGFTYWYKEFSGLIALTFALLSALSLAALLLETPYFAATLLRWSVGSIIVAVGGLFLLWCLHFIPDYLQIGPGFDALGLPQYGGRWMMMLPVIMAQFCAMIVINHWCYLKTGYIWLGVTFTSLLMAWMMVGGQVIGRFMA